MLVYSVVVVLVVYDVSCKLPFLSHRGVKDTTRPGTNSILGHTVTSLLQIRSWLIVTQLQCLCQSMQH